MPPVLEVDSISLGDDPAVRFRVIDRAADIDFVISIKAPNATRGRIDVAVADAADQFSRFLHELGDAATRIAGRANAP